MNQKLLLLGLIISFSISQTSYSQWINNTLTHDGSTRNYQVYVPNNYNESNPASMIVTLHGLGGTIDNFKNIGFAQVADTTNYVVVVPQAVSDIIAGTAWNSGAGIFGYYPNSNVDDIGFLNALIDQVQTDYQINPDQIYMCGYSMGGFMTQRMACEANEKLRAVASVAGTLGSAIESCNPGRAIPVAHFHGTADETVGYYENSFGNSVDDLISIWITNNLTNPNPVHTSIPDIVDDGFSIDHFLYTEGLADVELFQVHGAPHIWLRKPANDIDYAEEIIRFFNKTHEPLKTEKFNFLNVKLYPNPTEDEIYIDLGSKNSFLIECFDMLGKKIFSTSLERNQPISLKQKGVSKGMYILKLSNNSIVHTERIIVN